MGVMAPTRVFELLTLHENSTKHRQNDVEGEVKYLL
jgi:hypothetical protein